MKKIVLTWPIFQAVYPRPFETFAQLCIVAGRLPGYRFGVKVFERSGLPTAMNDLGKLVIAGGFDAAMVFDDDCFPPVDVIPRLLSRAFDEDRLFVAAAGLMRSFPHTTTAARYYPEGVTFVPGAPGERGTLSGFQWIDDLPRELVEVDFCGVPAAVIRREAFERTEQPWFAELDESGERVTHDVFFCRRLQAAGIPVYVDGTLPCGHLMDPTIVTFENRGQAREMAGAR